MNSRLLGAVSACVFSIGIVTSANAALIGRLEATPGTGDYQAYYDDQLKITWLADANAAAGTPWDYDPDEQPNDGKMPRATGMDWASNLSISGITGWRLPNMDVNGDGDIVNCSTAATTACLDNEYGYMYWQNGITPFSPDVFINIQSNQAYWSNTLRPDGPNSAWNFFFGNGSNSSQDQSVQMYAWAVYSGDVSTVPIPAAFWLFGSGLLGLVGMARKTNA